MPHSGVGDAELSAELQRAFGVVEDASERSTEDDPYLVVDGGA